MLNRILELFILGAVNTTGSDENWESSTRGKS